MTRSCGSMQIGVQFIGYVILLANFVANWFLLRFSMTRKQKQMNKNSRRISKTILRYLAYANLLQAIFAATAITVTFVRQCRTSDDMLVFRRICIAVSEAFYIVVAGHICLLLYHRYNHMISQALGKEPRIKKHKVKHYIMRLYGVAFISLTLTAIPVLLTLNESVHLAVKISSTLFTNVSIVAIFYFLFYSVTGIRTEILKRYQSFHLTCNTLNGQYTYCAIVLLFFTLIVLKEVFNKIEYIMASQLLWQLFFLLLPIAYYCNDRNFKTYVKTRGCSSSSKVTPSEGSSKKRRRQGTTVIPRGIDPKNVLTLCDRCKLPQPEPLPNTTDIATGTDIFYCTTCKNDDEDDVMSSTAGHEDKVSVTSKVSVISHIEALDLQRRQISTPVKLLITSAFHIKAAHGICVREQVVANHWRKVSMKRSISQSQVPSKYVADTTINKLKQRSKSEYKMNTQQQQQQQECIDLKKDTSIGSSSLV